MEHSVKSIRKKFAEAGVFYSDRSLAEMMKAYLPSDIAEVYDPTCGAGNLLAVFGDNIHKYGQEIDEGQALIASQLPNAHIIAGDTLKSPAFIDKKFRAIVANPPFGIKWEPNYCDARFSVAPVAAPASRADWAFLLHCLYYLSEDGICTALQFPGALYRGNAEGKIRQWFVDNGYIHEVVAVESGHFVDTKIQTALIIIKRQRAEEIVFKDNLTGQTKAVSNDEIKARHYTLSVSAYIEPIEEPKPPFDPLKAETDARRQAIKRIKAEIEFSQMVGKLEGYDVDEFCDEIIRVVNSYRKQPQLFI